MKLQRQYFDNIRGMNLIITQVDDYAVAVEYEDTSQADYSDQEVEVFLKDGVWVSIQPPIDKAEPAKPRKEVKVAAPQKEERIAAYISSMKALKEGEYARITLHEKRGYFPVDLIPKSGILEIDMAELDKSQIDKILAVLNKKGEPTNE